MSTFPATQRSLIEALRSEDEGIRERATDLTARVYRAPLIAVAMHKWGLQTADAEDLAHDFLLQAFEKSWFTRYDASRGRFRTFVRACLFAFASTRAEAASRMKRGGGVEHLSLDDALLPLPTDDVTDALFEREWIRSVLATAVNNLREECDAAGRTSTFAVFVAHDIEGAELDTPPTYAAMSLQFGIPVTQVTNFLNWARRRFRAHVLDTLRALTNSDSEFRAEARALLGVEVP